MAVPVTVPSVGESVSEGVISAWLKADGDRVDVDEPIFELETDKANQAIPAPAAGILRIAVEEGETVSVGSEVGTIEEQQKAESKESTDAEDDQQGEASSKNDRPEKAEQAEDQNAKSSPAVRQLAREHGVDLKEISGSGRDGRITREDVLAHTQGQDKKEEKDKKQEREQQEQKEQKTKTTETKPSPPSKPKEEEKSYPPRPDRVPAPIDGSTAEPGERREKMSAIRARISEKLVKSQQTTATLTTFNEADMSAVMSLRSQYKDKFKDKYDVGLGFMSFFVKACVEALKAFPLVNGRIDGNEIVTYDHCHIGVAVSTSKGLMVPIIRNAGKKSFADIEKEIIELATKARDGKITYDDLQGGTFTITNGGIFGSMLSTPILNPPQSGILGMHNIQKRAVVVDDEIVIRPMMYLALSYDHRLVDGREAVQFLVRVKECIEHPERMLLGV